MNRQDAEAVVTANMRAVFGFAFRRCRSPEDAEDLAQEIVLRAYQVLLARDDIREPTRFLWTVAHNALANYYREGARSVAGVPLHEVEEVIPDPDTESDPFAKKAQDEALRRMRRAIAYLSETRRRILVAYYFEHRRQADIAAELGVPVGTVKWHLFEAKRELRKGMETMRQNSELTFNPVTFSMIGLNGSAGARSVANVLRSPLTQNVAYCVRREAMTVGEIADALGVSPVYVEGEVKFLEEYGLLVREGEHYLANFLITEHSADLLVLKDKMYKAAAALVAEDLLDRLCASGILEDPAILGGEGDRHFKLWTLIPFILATSGEHLMDERITFEEVATLRPDGGHNIIHVDVFDKHMVLPADYVHMCGWCGPMWNETDGLIHWQIDHEWVKRAVERRYDNQYAQESRRVLTLYRRTLDGDALSASEYAELAERGYLRMTEASDGPFRADWQVMRLADREIVRRLLAMGDAAKEAHAAELEALKAPFVEAMLAEVAPHMRKAKQYELQFVFHSDGWFLLHCIRHLLDAGRLVMPTEEQGRVVTMLIYPHL